MIRRVYYSSRRWAAPRSFALAIGPDRRVKRGVGGALRKTWSQEIESGLVCLIATWTRKKITACVFPTLRKKKAQQS
jgi:hypothetical protein